MKRWQEMDKWSFLATLLLSYIGVALIWSATRSHEGSLLWIKQVIWTVIGSVFYLVMAHIDYKRLVSNANILYFLGILSLIAVYMFGDRINGAKSWFRLPFMSIQPSEIVKIFTVIIVAKYFSKYKEGHSSLKEFLVSTFLVVLPMGLIIIQPDLGTAIFYLPLFLIPNYLIGNRESIYVALGGGLMIGLLLLTVTYKPDWVFFLKGYQKDRIVAFLNPDQDTTNTGYQVHQSKISIGQGGLFGLGFGEGKQTKLGFLPAQYNDFILAVAAEELGFTGMLAIFGLYLFVFIRAFGIALEAGEPMGACLVILVVGTLVMQTLFNAAMLVGLVPTTGIPCPLISSGGSSYLATMGLLGLIQSVRAHRYLDY